MSKILRCLCFVMAFGATLGLRPNLSSRMVPKNTVTNGAPSKVLGSSRAEANRAMAAGGLALLSSVFPQSAFAADDKPAEPSAEDKKKAADEAKKKAAEEKAKAEKDAAAAASKKDEERRKTIGVDKVQSGKIKRKPAYQEFS
jgi:hypothetical protein